MKDEVAFIGDIHGAVEPLRKILHAASTSAAQIVFLGDYINRGKESRKTLDTLIDFKSSLPKRTVFLYGHHELALLDALTSDRSERFLRLGGAATLRQYPRRTDSGRILTLGERLPPTHREFLHSLKASFDGEAVFGMHCEAWAPAAKDGFGVFGHQPQKSLLPNVSDDRAVIDTGCGTLDQGRLTCFFWPSKSWVQAS